MENREIAAVFEEIGAILRILQEDPKWQFKAVAYDRAKRSIESYPERLEDIARDPNRKLTEIPGVGADLAAKIKELIETGQSQYHQELLKKIPRSLLEIIQVQGIQIRGLESYERIRDVLAQLPRNSTFAVSVLRTGQVIELTGRKP